MMPLGVVRLFVYFLLGDSESFWQLLRLSKHPPDPLITILLRLLLQKILLPPLHFFQHLLVTEILQLQHY